MNIAVFCSGNGSNFQAIADAAREGLFKADIALMVCDNPGAYAIKRAEKEGIRAWVAERKDFPSKREFEERIIEELRRHKVELICLAGYMRLLSPDFISIYRNRILNIHPALLPSFKGAHGIKDAMDYGVKATGVTVHFVTADMDAGPIILQECVKIEENDTEETLAEKIHKTEHRIYPEAVRLFSEGRIKVIGRKVKILAAAAIFLFVFGFESKAMFVNDIIPLPAPAEVRAPAVSLHEELKTDISIKGSLDYTDRLELSSFKLYDMDEIIDPSSGGSVILNPHIDTEKPLTKEEIEKMRIENSIKAARTLAEVMDSVNFKAGYAGISSLIDTAKKVIGFRNHVGERYHLHLKVDKDEAFLGYKRRF